MKYLPHDGTIYNTNFTDDILSVEWRESELENILWSEVGTRQDYEAEVG